MTIVSWFGSPLLGVEGDKGIRKMGLVLLGRRLLFGHGGRVGGGVCRTLNIGYAL